MQKFLLGAVFAFFILGACTVKVNTNSAKADDEDYTRVPYHNNPVVGDLQVLYRDYSSTLIAVHDKSNHNVCNLLFTTNSEPSRMFCIPDHE